MTERPQANRTFQDLSFPPQAELWRKENYLYTIAGEQYDIELFASLDGRYYAIGTPANKSRLIIYGSQIVSDAVTAIEQALKKINRDSLQNPIEHIGEDRE